MKLTIEKIKELRSKLPISWIWDKCYEFSYYVPPYIRKHWALIEAKEASGVCSLGLISHDYHSNASEFLKEDAVVFVGRSIEIVDTLLKRIDELESLQSSPQEKEYPEAFIRWLSVGIANREIILSLPPLYRYEGVEYTLPELLAYWKENINQK